MWDLSFPNQGSNPSLFLALEVLSLNQGIIWELPFDALWSTFLSSHLFLWWNIIPGIFTLISLFKEAFTQASDRLGPHTIWFHATNLAFICLSQFTMICSWHYVLTQSHERRNCAVCLDWPCTPVPDMVWLPRCRHPVIMCLMTEWTPSHFPISFPTILPFPSALYFPVILMSVWYSPNT